MTESYKEHLIKKIEKEYINEIRLNLELGLDTIKEDVLDVFQNHVTIIKIEKDSFHAACGCAGRFMKITWEEYDRVIQQSETIQRTST